MERYQYLIHIPYTNFEATVRISSDIELPSENIIARALDIMEDNGFDNAWNLKPSSATIEIIEM